MFRTRRQDYVGTPFLDKYMFDVELVETVFLQMKRGKAAGLDELTIEHLVNGHPVLVVIIAYVPYGFRLSYTVPLPKEEVKS